MQIVGIQVHMYIGIYYRYLCMQAYIGIQVCRHIQVYRYVGIYRYTSNAVMEVYRLQESRYKGVQVYKVAVVGYFLFVQRPSCECRQSTTPNFNKNIQALLLCNMKLSMLAKVQEKINEQHPNLKSKQKSYQRCKITLNALFYNLCCKGHVKDRQRAQQSLPSFSLPVSKKHNSDDINRTVGIGWWFFSKDLQRY